MRRLFATIALLLFVLPTSPATADSIQLYFSQNGAGGPLSNILRIPAAGGASETLQSGLVAPFGVAVDIQGGKVYWTDTGSDSIQRKNLDGSGTAEDLITTGLTDPHGIAVDIAAGKMYFADRFGESIKRANLDGTGVETLVEVSGSRPQNVALDLVNDRIYWSATSDRRIYRANLDGTVLETILSGSDGISGLAVDPLSGLLYFANRSQNKIQRADLDGSNVHDFLVGLIKPPLDIAIDVNGGKIYWSFFDGIQRTNLDLSGGIETLVSGLQGAELLNGVNGLALGILPIPEPTTALLLATGLAGLAVARRRSLH